MVYRMDRVSRRDDEVIGLHPHIRSRRIAVMAAMLDAPGGQATTAQIRVAAAGAAGDRVERYYWPGGDLAHLRWYKLVFHPAHRMWALTARGQIRKGTWTR